MARKRRDYKAEYRASKERATRAGYSGVSEYRAVRKALRLPPRTSPIPKRILESESPGFSVSATSISAHIAHLRREDKKWSDAHSRVPNSRYSPNFTPDQVERYYAAYVDDDIPGRNRKERAREKLRRLHDFLVPDFITEDEWKQKYRL